MRWAVLTAMSPKDSIDAVCYALIEAGCGGVMQTGDGPVKVQGSLPEDEELAGKLEALKTHLSRLPEWELPPLEGEIEVTYADDEDWATAWKQYYRAEKPGKTLVICPSWQHYEVQPTDRVITLDPGMAFGTGGHPTTRLCLLALEEHVKPGMRVADIGTGSGILAIGAALLGASEVLATDSDLLPRSTAIENVKHNSLESTVSILELDPFYQTAYNCDLIVANIIANTILELLPEIASRLKEGGVFIASGIVEEHLELLKSAIESAGFSDVKAAREDIWVCFTAIRTHSEPDTVSLNQAMRELPPLGSEWA